MDTAVKSEIRYVYYPSMVFVACKMPEDVPIAIMAVTAEGEGRIGWVDPEFRNQSSVILGNIVEAVRDSVKTGRLKIPDNKLWGYAHKTHMPANNIGKALGIEFKQIEKLGEEEFNKWEISLV